VLRSSLPVALVALGASVALAQPAPPTVATKALLRSLGRDRRALAAALAVAMLYGAAVWGVLPIRARTSWETHLAAALIGLALAFALRRRDPVPTVRYDWEDRDEVIDLDPIEEHRRSLH